jgi:hypothetical protein
VEEEDNWYSLDQVPTTSHLVKINVNTLKWRKKSTKKYKVHKNSNKSMVCAFLRRVLAFGAYKGITIYPSTLLSQNINITDLKNHPTLLPRNMGPLTL